MRKEITYKPFGKQAILIEWESRINEFILNDILTFKAKIIAEKQSSFVDIVQGYHSLTFIYKNAILDFDKEVSFLKTIYSSTLKEEKLASFLWQIPVCYDHEFGIDLQEISLQKELAIDEIIDLHSDTIYKVYFIGFLPGFLYLGGLNEQLFVDRKSNPRLNVVNGSVGIGGRQTGVYPNNSAGGWNIIGKTPINFFNVNKDSPCFAKAGDCIKFNSISLEEFYHIENEILKGNYQLVKEIQSA